MKGQESDLHKAAHEFAFLTYKLLPASFQAASDVATDAFAFKMPKTHERLSFINRIASRVTI